MFTVVLFVKSPNWKQLKYHKEENKETGYYSAMKRNELMIQMWLTNIEWICGDLLGKG